MTQRILSWAFYILLFLTPLFFTKYTNELFEYNKMMLVYALTTVTAAAWLTKMVGEKRLILKKTPLDLPILLFLISQILSTVFSIDPHTSLWGYYSRSNGGLFSILSYIILYYALVSNFDASEGLKFLKAALLGGVFVALWAIPEHFGVSPSCIMLTGQATDSCWVQEVAARVFATLGQPNWLAAYLGMLIFPALYFFLAATKLRQLIFYFLSVIIFYLAFTFTYSRGATLGVLAGLLLFLAFLLFNRFQKPKDAGNTKLKLFSMVLVFFVLINVLYGSALTRFQLITQPAPAAKPTAGGAATLTQLESGGTESGQIRLIVWKGALEIFKHYPVFGSGVETFAYSYYNFRPKEHNLVSEWDFLYNKAHNEYLNYLATTGLVGIIAYLGMILVFVAWGVMGILNIKYKISNIKQLSSDQKLLVASLLSGYISYLVQNFFGFSVVITALLFYLFAGFAFLSAEGLEDLRLSQKIAKPFTAIIYRRKIYTNGIRGILAFLAMVFIFTLLKFWVADVFYKRGNDFDEIGSPVKAFRSYFSASKLNNSEPLYLSELGYSAAEIAVATFKDDATTSATFKDDALSETEKSLRMSPANITLWRNAIRTYFQLSLIDPSFEGKTVQTLDKTISLAPTDPKLYYNKGLILMQNGQNEEAEQAFLKALELKPNYREAHFTLGVMYEQINQKDKAKTQMETVLKLVPGDPDATNELKKLENK